MRPSRRRRTSPAKEAEGFAFLASGLLDARGSRLKRASRPTDTWSVRERSKDGAQRVVRHHYPSSAGDRRGVLRRRDQKGAAPVEFALPAGAVPTYTTGACGGNQCITVTIEPNLDANPIDPPAPGLGLVTPCKITSKAVVQYA